MTPLNLWTSDTIMKRKIEAQAHYSKTTFSATEDFLDRMDLIGIDASLKLSFMGGLIQISGSAEYLHDEQLEENKVRTTLSYKATTRAEKMPYEVPVENVDLCKLVSDGGNQQNLRPTHVVTEVVYGLNGYMLFEKEFRSQSEKRKVAGSLSVVVKAIPSFSIEGHASVNFQEDEEEVRKYMTLTFYGDTILDNPPTTFEDAVTVYKELPQVAKQSNSTVAFTLTPITLYCRQQQAILNSISEQNVAMVATMQADFRFVEMTIHSLQSSTVATNYPRYAKILTTLKSNFQGFKNGINKNIQDVLPRIRGGGKTEQELTNIISKYQTSPYQRAHMDNFLGVRRKEIETITNVIEKKTRDSKIVVEDGRSGVGNTCLQDNEMAIVYTLRVLPSDDVAEAFANTTPGLWDESNKWFNNRTAVGHGGQVYREFLQFYQSNKADPICFLVALEIASQAHKPVQLLALQNGREITDDFIPPGRVTKVVEKIRGWNEYKIKVEYPSNKFVTKIQTKIWNVNKGESKEQATMIEETPVSSGSSQSLIHLTGLHPNTHYGMVFNLWSKIGRGPESSELIILTLPTSSPSDLKGKPLFSHSLMLEWAEPVNIAPNVTIKQYNWAIKKKDNSEIVGQGTQSTHATYVKVDRLQSAEHYLFEVKAIGKNTKTIPYNALTITSGEESLPSTISVTTLPAQLNAPLVETKSQHVVVLSWEPCEKIATGATFSHYVIKFEGQNQTFVQTSSISKKNVSGLSAGVQYEFKVQYVTTMGTSLYSDPLLVTTDQLKMTELDKLKQSLGLPQFREEFATFSLEVNNRLKNIESKYNLV